MGPGKISKENGDRIQNDKIPDDNRERTHALISENSPSINEAIPFRFLLQSDPNHYWQKIQHPPLWVHIKSCNRRIVVQY